MPFAPLLVFTGSSRYGVEGGLLVSQVDAWDAVDNNDYLSVRASSVSCPTHYGVKVRIMIHSSMQDVIMWPCR